MDPTSYEHYYYLKDYKNKKNYVRKN